MPYVLTWIDPAKFCDLMEGDLDVTFYHAYRDNGSGECFECYYSFPDDSGVYEDFHIRDIADVLRTGVPQNRAQVFRFGEPYPPKEEHEELLRRAVRQADKEGLEMLEWLCRYNIVVSWQEEDAGVDV